MTGIQNNRSLVGLNTFGIDVNAQYFVSVDSAPELSELVAQSQWQAMAKVVLGEGSNILLTQNIDGLVIKNNIPGIEKTDENKDHVWLKVGAGENWHRFVLYCLAHDYAGVENLSLIPGSIGAAPMQNIGAYGVEIKDVFEQLEAISLTDGATQVFSHKACHFGYRDSIFKNEQRGRYAITTVTLRLNKRPLFNISYGAIKEVLSQRGIDEKHLSIRAISDAVIHIRQSKLPDPKKIANAGSFFKNPVITQEELATLRTHFEDIPHYPDANSHVKVPAAWLIEHCGWKGKRLRNIGVHDRQALVLVNYGGGSGMELKALAEAIQQSVFDKFGIRLTPEVNIL